MLKETPIRHKLHQELRRQFTDALIIHELNLDGMSARIDTFMAGTQFCGFEIKSEADTSRRLERQMMVYNKCCERVTLVSHPKHLTAALKIIPEFWGVWLAFEKPSGCCLDVYREAKQNPEFNWHTVCDLPWGVEVRSMLKRLKLPVSGHKHKIVDRLVSALDDNARREFVRNSLEFSYRQAMNNMNQFLDENYA